MKVRTRNTFLLLLKPFSSSRVNLTKSSHPTTELVVSQIVNHEGYLLRIIADTDATTSSSILEAYTSDPFIETDENNIQQLEYNGCGEITKFQSSNMSNDKEGLCKQDIWAALTQNGSV
jgi:hypothetical protein